MLRILPPFYFVLAVATVLTAAGFLDGTLMRPAVLAQFLHYANYWIVGHGYTSNGRWGRGVELMNCWVRVNRVGTAVNKNVILNRKDLCGV